MMVQKRPADRLQSMDEVLVAIKSCRVAEPANSGGHTSFLAKDPALKQFLDGRKQASTPTIIQRTTDVDLDASLQQTLPSEWWRRR